MPETLGPAWHAAGGGRWGGRGVRCEEAFEREFAAQAGPFLDAVHGVADVAAWTPPNHVGWLEAIQYIKGVPQQPGAWGTTARSWTCSRPCQCAVIIPNCDGQNLCGSIVAIGSRPVQAIATTTVQRL